MMGVWLLAQVLAALHFVVVNIVQSSIISPIRQSWIAPTHTDEKQKLHRQKLNQFLNGTQ